MPSSFEPTPPSDTTEASVTAYRSVSWAAISALAIGLLAPLAFAGPVWWFLPAMGALVAASALRSTAEPGAGRTGRSIARLGLLLNLCFGVAAPTEMFGSRWLLMRSAEPFARAFFHELAAGQPQQALQFKKFATHRRALEPSLWDYYRLDTKAQRELKGFVEEPMIKTLLLLGQQVEVRLYETGFVEEVNNHPSLPQIYAVTFDLNGRKTTLFVTLILERIDDGNQTPIWRVVSIGGPIRPPPWEL